VTVESSHVMEDKTDMLYTLYMGDIPKSIFDTTVDIHMSTDDLAGQRKALLRNCAVYSVAHTEKGTRKST
jgi:hypothetical protein